MCLALLAQALAKYDDYVFSRHILLTIEQTLAFLVPALEKLFRLQWTPEDGVGVVIIAPLRELALQIFEVLAKVGCNHNLSAGLLIGGKDHRREGHRLSTMSILVCTPGRLLHHLDKVS